LHTNISTTRGITLLLLKRYVKCIIRKGRNSFKPYMSIRLCGSERYYNPHPKQSRKDIQTSFVESFKDFPHQYPKYPQLKNLDSPFKKV